MRTDELVSKLKGQRGTAPTLSVMEENSILIVSRKAKLRPKIFNKQISTRWDMMPLMSAPRRLRQEGMGLSQSWCETLSQ